MTLAKYGLLDSNEPQAKLNWRVEGTYMIGRGFRLAEVSGKYGSPG